MNLRHRLIQIRKLSLSNILRVLSRRLVGACRVVLERMLYTPHGRRDAVPKRLLRPIGLLHADVMFPEFRTRFLRMFPDDARRIIEAGHNAKDLILDLLGSGPIHLKTFCTRAELRVYPGDRHIDAAVRDSIRLVPWHFDVKSGVGWLPETFYSGIPWGAQGVDVKVPWELSRCQHFVSLGQAYALTGDESFTRAFCEQIEDWIRTNPPKFGVNWSCAMEVALRACNWLLAWEFFERSPAISAFVRTNLAPSLWEHGRHIAGHLEWGGELSTNHYLSDLVGLAYIGRALDNRSWFDFAVDELSAEIIHQTRPDGFDHESSTAYHKLVLEIFVFFGLAATSRGGDRSARRGALERTAGAPFVGRLRLMTRALSGLMDNRGRVPLIGDNDSGHVHSLLQRDDADMAYAVDLAALLLGEDRLRHGGPAASETVWFFGFDAAGLPGGKSVTGAAPPAPGASGLAVLKGPSDILVFAAQPNGTRGVGNHTHNDKLSFCLTVGRDEFLSDPGTLVYTSSSENRNAFRRTAAHTSVQVDDVEQNEIFRDQLFALGDDADAKITQFKEGVRVAGVHDGYSRLADPVLHTRSIERVASPLSWIIEDELQGAAEHGLRWRFVCGAGITAILDGPGIVRLIGVEGELEIKAHPAALEFQIEKGRLAPAYGVSRESSVVTTAWKGKLPFRATFTVLWYMNESVK